MTIYLWRKLLENRKPIYKILTISFAVLTILSSCTQTASDTVNYVKVELIDSRRIEHLNSLLDSNLEGIENSPELDYSKLDYNPLTGEYIEKGQLNQRPLVVMLDNQYSARPQAALSQADIVYEILAEGRITRYMAVFFSSKPTHIGPVRSSRPYFIEKALEFDPYYVHVGGSMQALSDIKKYKMADIDGLSSGAFWRENHKSIPHNMYTSYDVLLEDANNRNYNVEANINFLDFYQNQTSIEGEEANNIKFVYMEPTKSDLIGYYTLYKYNNEDFLYYRYTNGKAHVDENNNSQIVARNIIVQYVDTRTIDSEGRLKMKFVGTGEGRLYTAGKMIPVNWSKESATSPTFFYDHNGNPITLNPGITWFQIVETNHTELYD